MKKGVDKKRQACIINNCRCDMAVWKMEYHISQRRMFEKENIDKMFEQYKMMGGNSYVETIVREINSLPLKK